MANLDEEDVIEDDSFRAVLSFSPEVQEAIDQVLDGIILILVKVGVVFLYWNGRNIFVFFSRNYRVDHSWHRSFTLSITLTLTLLIITILTNGVALVEISVLHVTSPASFSLLSFPFPSLFQLSVVLLSRCRSSLSQCPFLSCNFYFCSDPFPAEPVTRFARIAAYTS